MTVSVYMSMAAAGALMKNSAMGLVKGFCRFLGQANSLEAEAWTQRDGVQLS